jgi:hypothetical protein
MDPETTIQRNPRVEFRKLAEGGGAVLLHLDTAAYHGLNEVGALIWEEVGEGVRLEELVSRVRSHVTDAPHSLSDEVAAFVRDLLERDLLVLPADGEAAAGMSG